MSDQDDLTIDIRIGTRATMNSGTPRVGPWSYHHVLPVRLYFMVAWTMLQICKHPNVWQSTARVGRDALLKMCQNGSNQNTVRSFLDGTRRTPTAEELTNIAKLCASPPAGGFGGPNPGQRTDDPHELSEPFAPVSAPIVWFSTLRSLREEIRNAYVVQDLPAPNTVISATKKVSDWCILVETMAGYISVAATNDAPRYVASDWLTSDNRLWTQVLMPISATEPNQKVRLRRTNEAVMYRDVNDPRLPPNTLRLQRHQDFLKIAPAGS